MGANKDENKTGGAGAVGAPGFIKVKALGLLAERLHGGGPVEVPCPADEGMTAAAVMASVGVPDEDVFVIIVNGRRVKSDHMLHAGDEVTFVPPVAGG